MNQQRTYIRARWKAPLIAQDLFLVLGLGGLLAFYPSSTLALALGAAIPVAIGWSVWTLHFPSGVEVDDAGIAFFAYGRVHRFAWRDIERIHLRRFVVQDRVLVRMVPAPPMRGRYWLLDSLDGYDALVRTLEEQSLLKETYRAVRAPGAGAVLPRRPGDGAA